MHTAILSGTEVLVVTDERYLDGRLEVNPSPSPTFLQKALFGVFFLDQTTTLYRDFCINKTIQHNTVFYAVLTHCVAARTRIGLL